jgi:arylsulfatase A-like enzyme
MPHMKQVFAYVSAQVGAWSRSKAIPARHARSYPLPSQILLLGLGFGILTGLAETMESFLESYFLRHMTVFNMDMLWMTPLADALIFLAVAGLLALIAQLYPRRITLFISILIFSALSIWSLLLMVRSLHPAAGLVLAAGLGVQIARVVSNQQARFVALRNAMGRRIRPQGNTESAIPESAPRASDNTTLFTRRQFLVVAGASLAGLTIGVRGGKALSEANTLANLPLTSSTLPNVLLIVLDTVRAQNLGLYGYARATSPNLERWAKQGVVFDWALSNAPWTLPSHSSFFTGKFPHQLSANWTSPLDGTYPTLAEMLSKRGYETAGFVANLVYASAEHGLARGFSRYEDYPISLGQFLFGSTLAQRASDQPIVRRLTGFDDILDRKSARDIRSSFQSWLDARDTKRPFFAFLNFYDAHEPYLAPMPFAEMFGPRPKNRNFEYMGAEVERPAKWTMTPAESQAELDQYDATLAYLDYELGVLHQQLAARNLLDNTLVIITSDHGEQFGEHGLFSHGNSLYVQSLHVPLMISFPGRVPSAQRIAHPVSLRDLPATVLEFAQSDQARAFGNSLTRLWSPSRASVVPEAPLLAEVTQGFGENWYPNAKGDMRSLLFGMQHFIQNGDGKLQVYDLARDPLEQNELDPAEWALTFKQFNNWLATMLKRS